VTKQPEGNLIMVVDSCPDDYERLVVAGDASGIQFTFLKTAEQALRFHAGPSVLVWMINMQLPCMTGLELFELLRPRLAHVPVLMVDDKYDAARELTVLEMGRLHYLCKPLDPSWLNVLHREEKN
jgi:DNA-binding response OmpR family regulator